MARFNTTDKISIGVMLVVVGAVMHTAGLDLVGPATMGLGLAILLLLVVRR